jgi:hypothetical protein
MVGPIRKIGWALRGFRMRKASDDSDRKLLSDVQQYGWHCVQVFDPKDPEFPHYAFTVGLYYTHGHPELFVMGLSHEVSHAILTTAANLIADGRAFRAGETGDGLIENRPCKFSPITLGNYKEYLGYGMWFYRSLKTPFPALQILWPDKQGWFPGDASYAPATAKWQFKI